MVEAGFAKTVAPVVDERPVAGLQLYDEAPDAESVAVPPLHTVCELTVIEVAAFTVTVELTVFEGHEGTVPVIV